MRETRNAPPPPLVLAIGGHDPCGGAGIQADIEAIAAQGAWAQTAVTALTIQDSCGLRRLIPVETQDLGEQIQVLLRDSDIHVVKVGLLASAGQAQVIAEATGERILVWDPVLAPSRGQELTDDHLLATLRTTILPHSTLVTPNILEARRLAGQEDLDTCARTLLDLGCQHCLLTGTHAPGPQVVHRLYGATNPPIESPWPRLPGEYHGSGCTLAAATAARLALGEEVPTAVKGALAYTWQALRAAHHPGRCQATPNRFHAWHRP